MKRFSLALFILVISAVAGHFAVLHLVPSVIMNKTMKAMQARGIGMHDFTLSPRFTPQTQTVVRPSPDLAYSICLYDLSDGGVLRVVAAPSDDYASVSFFDSNTNNFATVRVGAGEARAGEEILLYGPDAKNETPSIISPTPRGIILIRRLAPNLEAYETVKNLSGGDICQREPL